MSNEYSNPLFSDTQVERIRQLVIGDLRNLVQIWAPGGKFHCNEYTVQNPCRTDDEKIGNFTINTLTGEWSDFALRALGDHSASSKDPIKYFMYVKGYDFKTAIRELAATFGILNSRSEIDEVVLSEFLMKMRERSPLRPQDGVISGATCLMPVPTTIKPPLRNPKAKQVWTYRAADGGLLGFVERYEEGGNKRFLPLTYWSPGGWRAKHWPAPRPLYGLDRLAQQPEALVLVVEGEKAADAGQAQFAGAGEFVVISWPAGSAGPKDADWSPLAGRHVWLLPDHDEPGAQAMKTIGKLLSGRATTIVLLEVPAGKPAKWDVADEATLTPEWLKGLRKNWIQRDIREIEAEKERRLQPKPTPVPIPPYAPFPTPALRRLEEEIAHRVESPRRVASQQTALLVAASVCARRYRASSGQPCSLYSGFVYQSHNDMSRYEEVFQRAVRQFTGPFNIHDELLSKRQLADSLFAFPCCIITLSNLTQALKYLDRFPTLSDGYSLLISLYNGLDRFLTVDKKGKTTETVKVFAPTVNLLAGIHEDQVLSLYSTCERARGTHSALKLYWINGKPDPETPFTDQDFSKELESYAKRVREVRDAKIELGNQPPFLRIVEVEPQSRRTIKSEFDMRFISKEENEENGQIFRDFQDTVIRIATIMAAWDCPENPEITPEILQWAIQYELNRLQWASRRTGSRIHNGRISVYDRVLELVENAGEKGISHRNLIHKCYQLRDMEPAKREAFLLDLQDHGRMGCSIGRCGGNIYFALSDPDDD